MKVTSLFLSLTIITAHAEKNKRKVAKDTHPPRRFFCGRGVDAQNLRRSSAQIDPMKSAFFLSIGRKEDIISK